jgi:hypothetical protein
VDGASRQLAASAGASGVHVVMHSPPKIISGADTAFDFELKDAATGKEVNDIEPWLGAWAHVSIASADGGDFIHARPLDDVPSAAPTVPHRRVSTCLRHFEA